MAKVKFTGDPKRRGEGPRVKVISETDDGSKLKEYEPAEEVKAFGYTFSKGEAVDVEDELHLAKFRGNNHFEVEESKPEKATKSTKKAAQE